MSRSDLVVYEVEIPDGVLQEDMLRALKKEFPQHDIKVRCAYWNGGFKELDQRREYDAIMAAG